MYFPYFIAYMTVGFVISLLIFFWALRNGQFKDQERARFLPLQDRVAAKNPKPTRAARIETTALFTLVLLALAASIAVVGFSLSKALG